MMGQERGKGRASRPRWRVGDSPPYPTGFSGEERGGARGRRASSNPSTAPGQEVQATDGEIFWELKGPHSHPPHPIPCSSPPAGPLSLDGPPK